MNFVFSLFKTNAFLVAGQALIVVFGDAPLPASAQPTAVPRAWAPAAVAHAKKMRTFRDASIASQILPSAIPTIQNDSDPSGQITTYQPGGPTSPQFNAFFQKLGTNQRTCFTCHQPQTGWSISAADVQHRFNASSGADPIFRLVDGATCPTDDVSTMSAQLEAFKLLLSNGLIRVGLPLPAGAQFTVNVDDPYHCSNNATVNVSSTVIFSVYRRLLSTTNLFFQTSNPANLFMWDGREPDLFHQSIDATLIHAQSDNPPTSAQQDQFVSFESGLFTAQDRDSNAASLFGARAAGGAKQLSQQSFMIATPTSSAIPVFDLYTPWAGLTGVEGVNKARASIARGEALFNAKRPRGSCGGCHNTVNVGSNDNGSGNPTRFFNTGVVHAGAAGSATPASRFLTPPILPVFTVSGCSDQSLVVTDLGVAMITGLCTDIGKFKAAILRGLSARAPYFHDGSATSLDDVVDFYDDRFTLGLSSSDKQDLVNFLRAL
jgi:cytochrome c peroxidase